MKKTKCLKIWARELIESGGAGEYRVQTLMAWGSRKSKKFVGKVGGK